MAATNTPPVPPKTPSPPPLSPPPSSPERTPPKSRSRGNPVSTMVSESGIEVSSLILELGLEKRLLLAYPIPEEQLRLFPLGDPIGPVNADASSTDPLVKMAKCKGPFSLSQADVDKLAKEQEGGPVCRQFVGKYPNLAPSDWVKFERIVASRRLRQQGADVTMKEALSSIEDFVQSEIASSQG